MDLHFKVFDRVGYTRKVICKRGAADNIGQVGIHWALVLGAAVFVATSSYMEPSKRGSM